MKRPERNIEAKSVLMFENELDSKKVVYTSETEFFVQVGRYRRGVYKTRHSFKGDWSLVQAVKWYNAINIGNGYKKRLIAPSLNKPLLARAWS